MNHHRLTEAVANNEAWCSAVAASHGITAQRSDLVWHVDQPMPPLYPNIITLAANAQVDQLIEAIDPQLPTGWGIKDSFGTLDLSDRGFAIGFDAQWYCREPNLVSMSSAPGLELKTVTGPATLAHWTAAWGEATGILTPQLLNDESVELVFLERAGDIVSGLATNRSGAVVGISNAFGAPNDILLCVTAVCEQHPAQGVVGYGGVQELETINALGFEPLGNLRVWLKQ